MNEVNICARCHGVISMIGDGEHLPCECDVSIKETAEETATREAQEAQDAE